MAFTTVASSVTPVTLLAADATRVSAVIANSESGTLYILVAGQGTVSSTNYTVQIAASNGSFTVPSALASERVTGVWASSTTGKALITYK